VTFSLESLREYRYWIERGVALVVVVLLVLAWNRAHSAEAKLSKALQAALLEKANLLVEREVSKKEMKDREGDLLQGNADLAAEAKRLKDLLDEKPTVVEVVRWRTKVVEIPSQPADVPDRECPPPGPDGKPSKDILLLAGDKGHVEVAEITYGTKEGNRIIIGKGSCFRDEPTPLKLFESVIEAPLSSAVVPFVPSPRRWGAGVVGVVSRDGWALGPKVLFPPVWVLELDLGLALSPTGQATGIGSVGARW
jgi:hypothetical protein